MPSWQDSNRHNMTSIDAADNLQLEKEFDIPMTTNKITWMKGSFFDGFSTAPSQSITPMVAIEGTWGGENVIGY